MTRQLFIWWHVYTSTSSVLLLHHHLHLQTLLFRWQYRASLCWCAKKNCLALCFGHSVDIYKMALIYYRKHKEVIPVQSRVVVCHCCMHFVLNSWYVVFRTKENLCLLHLLLALHIMHFYCTFPSHSTTTNSLAFDYYGFLHFLNGLIPFLNGNICFIWIINVKVAYLIANRAFWPSGTRCLKQ